MVKIVGNFSLLNSYVFLSIEGIDSENQLISNKFDTYTKRRK